MSPRRSRLCLGSAAAVVIALAMIGVSLAQLPPPPPSGTLYGTVEGSAGRGVIAIVQAGDKGTVCGYSRVVALPEPVYALDLWSEGQRPGCGAPGRAVHLYVTRGAGEPGYLAAVLTLPGPWGAINHDLAPSSVFEEARVGLHIAADGVAASTPVQPSPSPTATATLTASATPTTPAAISVSITSLFYNSTVPNETSGEHVVIRNNGSAPLNMNGWKLWDDKLLDGNGTGIVYTFGNFTLAAGASVTVHNCTGANTTTDLYSGVCQAAWNNEGDTAILVDAGGIEQARYAY